MSRLATKVLATALLRLADQRGGAGMVLARGDPDAGGLVVVLTQRGEFARLLERGHDLDGRPEWRPITGQVIGDQHAFGAYLERRRTHDRDLWAIELDVADSERFAAEMTAMG